MATMKKGDRGPGVLILQSILHRLHYTINATDGIFGDETYQAIRAFQEAMGIKVDGVVGDETANAIVSKIWTIGEEEREWNEDEFTEVS